MSNEVTCQSLILKRETLKEDIRILDKKIDSLLEKRLVATKILENVNKKIESFETQRGEENEIESR